MTIRHPLLRLVLAGLALTLVAAACGDDDDVASGDESGVEVDGAWSRATAPAATTGAIYMELTSDGDRALVGASVPDDIAGKAELHETVMADDDMSGDGSDMSDMDDDAEDMDDSDTGDMGGMTMQEVTQIDLPAGEATTLEPGGYHVMLFDLASPLEAGDTFTVTLSFDDESTMDVEVEVRDDAP